MKPHLKGQWEYWEGVPRGLARRFVVNADYGIDSGFSGSVPTITGCDQPILISSNTEECMAVPWPEHAREPVRWIVLALENMPKPFMRPVSVGYTETGNRIPVLYASRLEDIQYSALALRYAREQAKYYLPSYFNFRRWEEGKCLEYLLKELPFLAR